jgi:organic radical activating enzyme
MPINPKKKFFLFKQSKHFCSVPWNYFKVSTDGTISTCVFGSESLGNITDEFMPDPNLLDIKQSLYNDILPNNCTYCQSQENDNYKFLRDLYNPMFVSADVDYSNVNEFKLSGVDLHWSSICDLKCITCWAPQSSSIAVEQGLPILHVPTNDANQLIDRIVENQAHLKEIYLSGGEPTLIKHNLLLLQKLDKDINCTIRINTNMMFKAGNQIIEELKKFSNVLFTISADAMESRYEYIRYGADWKVFLKNLELLQQVEHFKWRLNSVFFVASALYLTETQEFFRRNFDINDFTINQIGMGHDYLKCRNLPVKSKEQCVDKLAFYMQMQSDQNLLGQIKTCMLELHADKENSYEDFFNNVDRKYNTNWQVMFPEIVDA